MQEKIKLLLHFIVLMKFCKKFQKIDLVIYMFEINIILKYKQEIINVFIIKQCIIQKDLRIIQCDRMGRMSKEISLISSSLTVKCIFFSGNNVFQVPFFSLVLFFFIQKRNICERKYFRMKRDDYNNRKFRVVDAKNRIYFKRKL